MTQKSATMFGQSKGDFIHRHVELRVQPKEETFPIPLTHIDQNNTHKLGCVARKPYRWLLECRRGSQFIRVMDRIHEFHFIERKKTQRIYMVREASSKMPDLTICWLKFGSVCQNQLNERKSNNGLLINRSSIMRKRLRDISFDDPDDGDFKETIENTRKVGGSDGGGCVLQDGNKEALEETAGNCWRDNRMQRKWSMHASWKLMNLRESAWNPLYQKVMKIISRKEGSIRQVTFTRCSSLS